MSILSRPTESPTAAPERDEPGDGRPPTVYGDCVIEVSRQTTGILERITYGEKSCAEDGRHISFTIGPLLSSSIDDTTFVCAEQL